MEGRQLSEGWGRPTLHMDCQFLAKHVSAIGTPLGVVVQRRYMQTVVGIRMVGVQVYFAGNVNKFKLKLKL